MSGSLAPFLKQTWTDSNGNPLSGGKIYSYQAGTTTPQATYTDSSLVTPNTNPVILNAAGQADVWLDPSLSYKFILQDSNGVQQWSVDNVIGLLTASAVNTASLQARAVTYPKIQAVTSSRILGRTTAGAGDIEELTVGAGLNLSTGVLSGRLTIASASTTGSTAAATDLELCSGTITRTIPSAVTSGAGRILRYQKTDNNFNVVTLTDGTLTTTLNTFQESVVLISDGSNWSVISRDYPRNPTAFTMTINGASSNPTKGTATEIAYWTRAGSLMNIYYSLIQTVAGTAGSGNYYFILPGGLTANSTFIDTGGNQANNAIGHGQTAANSDASSQSVEVWLQSSTNMMLGQVGGSIIGSSSFALNNGTVKYVFRATIPITGWN